MGSCALILSLVTAAATGAPIEKEEVHHQDKMFGDLWYEDFEWQFDKLPTKGSVPKDRIPYSGHMYLDKQGGTSAAMRVYDTALNSHRGLVATGWEQGDTAEAYGGTRTIVPDGAGFGASRRSMWCQPLVRALQWLVIGRCAACRAAESRDGEWRDVHASDHQRTAR